MLLDLPCGSMWECSASHRHLQAPGITPVPAGLGDWCPYPIPAPARMMILQSLFQGCCSKHAFTPAQTTIPLGSSALGEDRERSHSVAVAGIAPEPGGCQGSIPEDRVLQIIQVSQRMQHPSTSPSRPLLSSPPGSSQCSREGSHVLNMLLLPHTEIRDPCQRNKWSGFFSSPCFTLLPVEGSH